MPEMRFHDLRHTFASLALSGNESAYVVSRWLGHANVTTTDAIYAHMYPSDHESNMDRFAKVVAAGRG